MAAIEQSSVPESLVEQCQYFILMHLDEFPVSRLSLLPLHVRKELLWKMPLADVCQLEGTMFTDGLDMAAYWKHPFNEQMFDMYWWWGRHIHPGEEISKICYFHEWGATEYERAMLYGLLTAYAFGSEYLPDNFRFRSPLVKDGELDGLTLLYAVRRCDPMFPSRYSHDPGRELTVDEVVRCFGRHEGELPKIFQGNLSGNADLNYAHFLYNVVCLRFQWFHSEDGEPDGFEFVKAVVKGATNLETLILDQLGEEDRWICLDVLCDFLSSQTTFLSKFRRLTIHSSSSLRFLGFTVSRMCLNALITAYFAAPTDHVQKLELAQTKIESYNDLDICSSPTVDQCYLQFKTFEFDSSCQFVSEYDATPATISNWLGQSISKLETPNPWQCLFKVDKETNVNTQKRKHTEAFVEGDCNHTDN